MNSIYGASTRRGGNTDYAATLVQKTWNNSAYTRISEENIGDCIACGYCEIAPPICVFNKNHNDKASYHFQQMFTADKILFISPIYFYHVPAQFKAFLDRAQAWFSVPEEEKPGKGRSCGLILLGARDKGDKLFEGSILSVRYSLKSLGFKLHDPLLLYGLDHKTDLVNDLTKRQQIIDYAQYLATN